MNQSLFNKLLSGISSSLLLTKELGHPITTSLIDEEIDDAIRKFSKIPNFVILDEEIDRLKFQLGSVFSIKVGEEALVLHDTEVARWFDSRKSDIDWSHWNAYKNMLLSQARPIEVIDANEKVIDSILDFSGDPETVGTWSRKGLVMGNVQSGKTQNYLGLINKAIDSGYKVIILLGGHLNDLRKQTQERVDEGVLGRESKHLVVANSSTPAPIGVGIYGLNNVNTGTTTAKDFTKSFADSLGFKLGTDPVVFTIKKHTTIMASLYNWIKEHHYLNPEDNIKLDSQLLLIDDEADYASINTKAHKEELTKTNEYIRKILSLFNRNTYVGYTATPFANIFIDPDDNTYSDKDDLFPSDFMVKIPVPENYMGQDFFFKENSSSTILINDHDPIYQLKSGDSIQQLPESLKEAVRSFVIVISIRNLRGEKNSHNTMLVNISHLKLHQDRLEFLISEYQNEIHEAIVSFSGLGVEEARNNITLKEVEKTFRHIFTVDETYENIFSKLRDSSGKINVWAVNQKDKKADAKVLDYSIHKQNGLCAIVIGGHKLSRGLTLEGLSISYFARNSKAYDTLMQMCRWFGYRPSYKDLCRVYLPYESLRWYSFIASTIRELYSELELMGKMEKRPTDFGLKVREHPGAMLITARNKMGSAESEVRTQDLWGQVQRRFRFRKSIEENVRNINYSESFLNTLINDRKNTGEISYDISGSLILSNVDYNDVIKYIKNIDLLEDDVGNAALIEHLMKMKKSGLPNLKVALFNQKGSRTTSWEKVLDDTEQSFLNKEYTFCGQKLVLLKRAMKTDGEIYSTPSVHLGNSDDEKIFLSKDAQENVVKLSSKKPVSFDYICSEERGFPGLIIYLFAVATIKNPYPYKKDDSVKSEVSLGHGCLPTLGYSISLPRPDNLKGKSNKEIRSLIKETRHSYQVNKLYRQLDMSDMYEDYDDE